MDLRIFAQEEIMRLEKQRTKYEKMLEGLPKGKLSLAVVKGKKYYYLRDKGGKKYIGDGNSELVRKLQLRRFLEDYLTKTGEHMKFVENFIDGYSVVTPDSVLAELPKTYRGEKVLGDVGMVFVDGGEWAAEPYEKSTFRSHELNKKTLKGDNVRSMAELAIANMLYSLGIPYRYEEVLWFGETRVIPDFRIYSRKTGKIVILEHCGMMNNRDYYQAFFWKLRQYVDNGYTPWEDVFFTFNSSDGNINTQSIMRIIETYFT